MFINRTGPDLFEEANQRVASGTTVQPKRNRIVAWVLSRLEEPEEHMQVLANIDVPTVRIHTGRRLTNALFARLLVTDSSTG